MRRRPRPPRFPWRSEIARTWRCGSCGSVYPTSGSPVLDAVCMQRGCLSDGIGWTGWRQYGAGDDAPMVLPTAYTERAIVRRSSR